MSDQHRERTPGDLREIAELLQHERPEATALELDGIKLRAKAARRPALIGKGNGFMRSRVVSFVLATGLLGGGTAAMAAAGGPLPFDILSNGHEGASNSQYCPPMSWHPGKPKKPGPARCGKGPGDDQGHGNDEGDDPDNGNANGTGHAYGHSHGNGNGQGNGNAYGHGHGHGNDAVTAQGNGGGRGNGNAGRQNVGGKGGGKHK
jgi:hypothetical protein